MDKKELQPVTPGELAAPAQTTVNQYGDKSVHIDTVTHMSQNVTILPIMQRTSTGGMKASTQAVSKLNTMANIRKTEKTFFILLPLTGGSGCYSFMCRFL